MKLIPLLMILRITKIGIITGDKIIENMRNIILNKLSIDTIATPPIKLPKIRRAVSIRKLRPPSAKIGFSRRKNNISDNKIFYSLLN